MRRLAGILSVALITAGVVVLADAAATLAWKEPVSALYAQLQQERAADDYDQLRATFTSEEGSKRLDNERRRMFELAKRFRPKLRRLEGEGVGRLRIPAIGVEQTMVEGTDPEPLQKGPGRYPETGVPGLGRTIGVAGHRTTYGAPFRELDELDRGDRIELEMPYGTVSYAVRRTRIVEPTATEIVRDRGSELLVLTACHPLYSAAERIAIFAEVVAVDPRSRRSSAS